jgi:hypothetical protein
MSISMACMTLLFGENPHFGDNVGDNPKWTIGYPLCRSLHLFKTSLQTSIKISLITL